MDKYHNTITIGIEGGSICFSTVPVGDRHFRAQIEIEDMDGLVTDTASSMISTEDGVQHWVTSVNQILVMQFFDYFMIRNFQQDMDDMFGKDRAVSIIKVLIPKEA